MKPIAKLFAILVFGMTAQIVNAEFIKVPVDSLVVAASGTSGYDPTVVGNGSPSIAWSVQPSTAPPNRSVSAQSIVSAAGTDVGSLIRWPAGGKPERVMQGVGPEAYYRDAFIGLRYTAHASKDGDAWTTKAVYPTEDGGSRTQSTDWTPVTYYAQVGGIPSCWYSAGWLYYICGTMSLDITAYKQTQCDPAGGWTLQVYQNGAAFGSPSAFTMNLEVPPSSATPESPLLGLNQNTSPRYPYDSMCYRSTDKNNKARVTCDPDPSITTFPDRTDSTLRAFSIGQKGCALTAAAMVNAYHNGSVPNGSVIGYNDAVKAAGGFVSGPPCASNVRGCMNGQVIWTTLARGGTSWIGFGSNNNSDLRQMICKYGPQVMSVNGGGHFVMVVGKQLLPSPDWKIYDPRDGAEITLGPRHQLLAKDGTRLFRGPEAAYSFPIYGLTIRLRSPAELLITSPDGSKTGFDPITGAEYKQIPYANYLAEGYDDDETGEIEQHKVKFINIGGGAAANGEYLVQVVGTATGTYSMDIERIGNDGRTIDSVSQNDIPTQYGDRHTYAVQYSAASSLPPAVLGGYDGGGQKPSDVNKFLRYSSPSAAHTTLAAGSTSFRLAISYGNTMIPGTFTATLNGAEVSPLFSPSSGILQVIQLPLSRGSNTLVLAVDGRTASGRVATDTDRLVFNVP